MTQKQPPMTDRPILFSSEGENDDLPEELLAQLSVLPEPKPDDFECIICKRSVSNQWNWSPRDYERAPICKSCETVKGYSYNGRYMLRQKPKGCAHGDARLALRIDALADAIAHQAQSIKWRASYAA